MNAPTVSSWWLDAPRVVAQTNPYFFRAPRASYRLGDVTLDLESTYAPLLDELENAYGDCAVSDVGTAVASRVICSAHSIGDLIALHFDVPATIPNLCTIAAAVLRPRAELQHFVVRPLDAGWQLIANTRDEDAPLLAADACVALFNPSVEPAEFLLNFVVAVAQLAQETILFVHGGGVSIEGRGTLLVGRSGQGKSTTTAAVAARGHALFGDETVGIRTDIGEMRPLRRTMKVRPGPRSEWVRARLESTPHAFRKDANGIDCAWVRPSALFPASAIPASAPLTDVFFLRRFAGRPSVERFVPTLPANLEEFQALTMSLSAVASWPLSPAHRAIRFARIADLFAKCHCYFLDLGSPDATAELIERTVLDNAERA